MDVEAVGRHALLFDDDATATFVNSQEALVPWSGDAALLIDRYDVRHLLDRIPPRRRHAAPQDVLDPPALKADLDRERYLDLPPPGDDASETLKDSEATGSGTYQTVPFSYVNIENSTDPKNSDSGVNGSSYHPPFPVPESLLSNLPPTEKLHQIIARTALFVGEHGGQSEIVLRVKQGDNPIFGFLMPDHHLHQYFRFLVDHPQLLKTDTDSSEAQEQQKSVNEENEPGGALSLLGSVYGSGEDDDSIFQAHSKGMESSISGIAADATHLHRSEQGEAPASKASEDKEAIMHTTTVAAKEKTISIKRNHSVNVASVNAARNKKAEHETGSLLRGPDKTQSSQPPVSHVKALILEPPSFLKRMMDKIVEFILRNGKEFEAVLIEQDKTIGRFPFLLPSNQYHSYYLKLLQEAHEGHVGSKKKVQETFAKESYGYNQNSEEQLEGWLCDPNRKEKFKMVIGGPKKDSHDHCSASAKKSGVSADEAAAIVLAATRGVSPANARETVSKDESVSGRTYGDGGRASSIGSLSSSQGHKLVPKPVSNYEASISLPGSTGNLSREGLSKVDDVWIAKAIAKTAALAASSEADSSEASLTKEQKLKAERLKRAKMFATMIKSGGHCIDELVNSVKAPDGHLESTAAGSNRSGAESDLAAKEREGSSVPYEVDTSDRVHSQEKDTDYDHTREHRSEKKYRTRSRDHDNEDSEDNHKHHKKKHRSEHSASRGVDRHKHKKSRSSSKDEESRHHHKRHSHSDDEHKHKKSSGSQHSCKNHDFSGDKDQDMKRYDRHRRKHRLHSERKIDIEGEDSPIAIDQSEVSVGLINHHCEEGKPAASDVQPAEAITEVPNELRAKIRAMLLETM